MKKVCVVGLGYIGLPTAAMFASRGHEVVGVDINPKVINSLNAGKAHFKEPELELLLAAATQTGRFQAKDKPSPADVFILAVPTPFSEGRKPDLSYVDAATDSIASIVEPGNVVILESTSPVGTTERMRERLAKARLDLDLPTLGGSSNPNQVRIAHCPERILPGRMVHELVANDRIIGGLTDACAKASWEIYQTFVKGEGFLTDCRTAEFVKLIENSFRDVNIAFANELSMICDYLDLDVWKAIALANKHPRVSILTPGPGVGGHCIAVDPWFIVDSAPEQSELIHKARTVNLHKTEHTIAKIEKAARRFREPIIACFGLTYKNDVEDLRESPALEIAEHLAASDDIRLMVCEPLIDDLPISLQGKERVQLVDVATACRDADILVFLVGHRQFRNFDPKTFLNKVVIDTIGLLSTA